MHTYPSMLIKKADVWMNTHAAHYTQMCMQMNVEIYNNHECFCVIFHSCVITDNFHHLLMKFHTGADPGFDQGGGAQIVTGLKLPFWGLSFVEFWCWGLIFGGQGGPGPLGPPLDFISISGPTSTLPMIRTEQQM